MERGTRFSPVSARLRMCEDVWSICFERGGNNGNSGTYFLTFFGFYAKNLCLGFLFSFFMYSPGVSMVPMPMDDPGGRTGVRGLERWPPGHGKGRRLHCWRIEWRHFKGIWASSLRDLGCLLFL